MAGGDTPPVRRHIPATLQPPGGEMSSTPCTSRSGSMCTVGDPLVPAPYSRRGRKRTRTGHPPTVCMQSRDLFRTHSKERERRTGWIRFGDLDPVHKQRKDVIYKKNVGSKSISLDCSVRPGHYAVFRAGSFEVSGCPGVRVSGHLSRDGSLGWGRTEVWVGGGPAGGGC